MARELSIVVTADTLAAVESLKKVNQAVTDVEKGAGGANKSVGGFEATMKAVQNTAGKFDASLNGMIGQFAKISALIGVGAVVSKGFSLLAGGISSVASVALEMNSSLEKSTLQFTTLMGNSAKAEAHVRSLFDFAKRTPFETGPIITASKHLQLFGGDALNTTKNLEMLGDASAASGANFEEVAFWTGRMYASLQAGKPIGEAMMRLMELGVVTPEARNAIERLSETANGGAKAFAAFQASLGKFTGAMALQANTFDGLMSTISDAVQITIADALEPFFEMVKQGASVIAQVLGSEGLQQTFSMLAQSIKQSLGSDTEMQVKNLLKVFVSLGEGIVAISDIAVRALYGLKFALNLTTEAFAQTSLKATESTTLFYALTSLLPGVGKKYEDMTMKLVVQRAEMEALIVESRKQRDEAEKGIQGNSLLGKALDSTRVIMQSLRTEIDKATVAQSSGTVVTQHAANAMSNFANNTGLSEKQIAKTQKKWKEFLQDINEFASIQWNTKAVDLEKIFEFKTDPMIKAQSDIDAFQKSVTSFSDEMQNFFNRDYGFLWTRFAGSVKQASEITKSSSSGFVNFGKSLESLPTTIVGALQGGGDVLKSVGASLIGGLGVDLGKRIAEGIGGKLGSALGSLGGPIGSALGAAAGKLAGQLFGKVFGPSQQKQVMDMRAKFFDANGGLEAMQQRANLAGVSINALFNVRTVQEFERATQQFNKELAASEEKAAKAKEELAKMNTELGDLLREAGDLGVVLPDSMQGAINKLLESGQLTDENRKLLEALGMGSQSQFKAMEDAAKKYGVELSALGPAFNQNKLNERAADIIQSFNLMMQGGADLTGVITGMSDEINDFVQASIRTGATVPENMRPILDAMLKQGALTDANGKKLEDLGAINFGAPIETATDKLIKKIQELIDKLVKGMPDSFEKAGNAATEFAERATDAINSIPDEVRVRFVELGEMPGFDQGGVVGRDFRAASSRDVIPAMLRPGEVVLTPEQAVQRGSISNSPINVSINVAGYLDSSSARQQLASIVSSELGRELRQRRRVA